jgi:hypothetical protein
MSHAIRGISQSAPAFDGESMENHETFSDWRELTGSPMCAPSSDKTSFCGRFESVSFKRMKDGARSMISKECSDYR